MTDDELEIRPDVMSEDDRLYELGGLLVGTDWVLPDGVDTVDVVRETSETIEGQTMKFPELRFKNYSYRLSVEGFLRRIDPGDIGDIEPAELVSERIVEKYRRTTPESTAAD